MNKRRIALVQSPISLRTSQRMHNANSPESDPHDSTLRFAILAPSVHKCKVPPSLVALLATSCGSPARQPPSRESWAKRRGEKRPAGVLTSGHGPAICPHRWAHK